MHLAPVYSWSETETSLRITLEGVALKDQSQLFCSDRLVKLNAPPHLLLLDLHGAIDEERSSAIVQRGGRCVVLQLHKAQPGLWGRLVASGSKQELQAAREESVRRAHAKQLAAAAQRAERKQQEAKAAVDLQMAQEAAQRKRLEDLKQQELQQERDGLAGWQRQLLCSPTPRQQVQQVQQVQLCVEGDESDYEEDEHQEAAGDGAAMPDHPDYYGRGWRPPSTAAAAAAGDGGGSETAAGSDEDAPPHGGGDSSALDSTVGTGAGRSSSSIAQTAPGCDIWPAAAEPAAASSDASSSTSAELLSAGHEPLPAPLLQHAAAVRCPAPPVKVTFTQLETAHLPARQQREVEIRSIKRQAQGQPDSVDVADRQPAFLKDKGDALAAQGNFRGALNAYSRALELDAKQPALWANRAACHLALGEPAECVQDCDAGIELLKAMQQRLQEAPGSEAESEVLAGMLPAAAAAAGEGCNADAAAPCLEIAAAADGTLAACEQDQAAVDSDSAAAAPTEATAAATAAGATGASAKLLQQLVKLLARRAAAHMELQQLAAAESDLQQALRLDPGNAKLQADALEVAAALDPASALAPCQIKQRGDARFRAGDMTGAAEAYTALVQQLQLQEQEQQQQGGERTGSDEPASAGAANAEQQQLLLSALSNRAACALALDDYAACLQDCQQALLLALGERGTAAADSTADVRAQQLLHDHAPQQLLQHAGAARVRCVARLAGRMAVAHGCLKQADTALALYGHAAALWRAAGEPQRAQHLEGDAARLRQLLLQPAAATATGQAAVGASAAAPVVTAVGA